MTRLMEVVNEAQLEGVEDGRARDRGRQRALGDRPDDQEDDRQAEEQGEQAGDDPSDAPPRRRSDLEPMPALSAGAGERVAARARPLRHEDGGRNPKLDRIA